MKSLPTPPCAIIWRPERITLKEYYNNETFRTRPDGDRGRSPPRATTFSTRSKSAGTGGWDYVTGGWRQSPLYVSHGTSIAIVDTDTGSVVGGVSELHGVHGIASRPELNKGFISKRAIEHRDGCSISPPSPRPPKSRRGKIPMLFAMSRRPSAWFTFNGRSGDSTAIDAKSNAVLATFPLGGKPEFCVALAMGSSTTTWKTSRNWWRSMRQTRSHPHRPSSTRAMVLPAWPSIPRMACCFPSAAIR